MPGEFPGLGTGRNFSESLNQGTELSSGEALAVRAPSGVEGEGSCIESTSSGELAKRPPKFSTEH